MTQPANLTPPMPPMPPTPRSLHGRHAVVTGGGSGIGAAIAQALLCAGARVTLMGRDPSRLARQRETLALSAGDSSAAILTIAADVTSTASVEAAFSAARQQAGAIDILVNNAGQAQAAPLVKTDDALWQRLLDVNLSGVFRCTRAVLPAMLEQGSGRIVNVASTAGQTGYAYVAAYCAAKHGVLGLTRALALEVATRGVTVNAVCPGYTETALLADAIAQIVGKTALSEQAARGELLRANPQRRFIMPAEVANAVLWLCAPGAEAITGQAIAVAGGEIM
jgi:NAD(P)-dependent dehydrogenase (short-subunit alcohol dehydrogenase family)